MLATAADVLAFSSVWVALAAGALAAAASAAMGLGAQPAVLGVVTGGTLLVYNLDRLRDLPRDRRTSPHRSDFVARHRRALARLAAGSGALALACGVAVGPEALWVLVPVAALGLGHRRIKHVAFAKSLYVSGAWVVTVVGFPAVAGHGARGIVATAAVLGLALVANAIASSVRDGEAAVARIGAPRALAMARGLAVAGCLAAWLGPGAAPGLRALGCVPAATLAALLAFRPDERFGLLVVDGALLAGGLASWVLSGRCA